MPTTTPLTATSAPLSETGPETSKPSWSWPTASWSGKSSSVTLCASEATISRPPSKSALSISDTATAPSTSSRCGAAFTRFSANTRKVENASISGAAPTGVKVAGSPSRR